MRQYGTGKIIFKLYGSGRGDHTLEVKLHSNQRALMATIPRCAYVALRSPRCAHCSHQIIFLKPLPLLLGQVRSAILGVILVATVPSGCLSAMSHLANGASAESAYYVAGYQVADHRCGTG